MPDLVVIKYANRSPKGAINGLDAVNKFRAKTELYSDVREGLVRNRFTVYQPFSAPAQECNKWLRTAKRGVERRRAILSGMRGKRNAEFGGYQTFSAFV